MNEVESDDGSNPDWIELYNTGTSAVDLSGFVLKDNDDTHIFTIPSGTSIASHGFLAFDALGFGLGSADAARLFSPTGTLIDSYTWAAHAATTYGRCADGTGDFVTTISSTKARGERVPRGAAGGCSLAGRHGRRHRRRAEHNSAAT